MKKTNYHTHTKRCMHAEGTEADYVKAALNAGLDVLGFSDHGPFPDNRFDSRMPYADLDEYLACMDALRPTVPFPILKGLEIEYCPDSRDYYSFLLKEKSWIICCWVSIITRRMTVPTFMSSRFLKNRYARIYQICPFRQRSAENRILPDSRASRCIFNNPYSWDDNCEEACDIILNAAVQTGAVLELNANGIRKGIQSLGNDHRWPYPYADFWKKSPKLPFPS